MISAKDFFLGSGLGPESTGDGRCTDAPVAPVLKPLEEDEVGPCLSAVVGVLFETAGLPSLLPPRREVDAGLTFDDGVPTDLSANRDTDAAFAESLRTGPFATGVVRGVFAAEPGSSFSALRFGADKGFEGVEEDGAGLSPVMEARRSLILVGQGWLADEVRKLAAHAFKLMTYHFGYARGQLSVLSVF